MNNISKVDIGEEVWYSVDKKIWGVIGNIVTIQVLEQVKNQLRNQVRDKVSIQAWQEVKQNIEL